LRRLTEFVVAHRARLDRWLRVAAIVAPALAVVAGVVHYAVTRDASGIRFLVLYVAPMFLIAPIWLRHRLADVEQRSPGAQAIDAGLFVLAMVRFVSGGLLPFSGHMLFLTYTGITVRVSRFRWLAALLLLETTVFKLLIWRDPKSWGLGIALGALAGVIATSLQRRS
jgi:hypothetical protein